MRELSVDESPLPDDWPLLFLYIIQPERGERKTMRKLVANGCWLGWRWLTLAISFLRKQRPEDCHEFGDILVIE